MLTVALFQNLSPVFDMTQFIDVPSLVALLLRFALNLAVVWIIVHFFYYRRSRRREYYFTFIMIAVSIFMLIHLMDDSKMKIGAALGLFAVFGVLRYRTESIPIREMTYLFFLVALSVVNGMACKISIVELLVSNCIFILIAAVCESDWLVRQAAQKYVKYDRIDLIVPERRAEMVADLEQRLGVKIIRVEIGSVDFLRDTALLKVTYRYKSGSAATDKIVKLPPEYE